MKFRGLFLMDRVLFFRALIFLGADGAVDFGGGWERLLLRREFFYFILFYFDFILILF